MNAIRALAWKEAREALPKVLIALGLCALVYSLRANAAFNRNFSDSFDGQINTGMMIMAVLMAMNAVAGERGKGTLPFLLGKPLGVGRVLAVKFAVGLAGLWLVTLAAWATVYLDPASLDVSYEYYEYRLRLVQDIDYWSMVGLEFGKYAMMYALVFVGSALTDNPFKGAAVGFAMSLGLGVVFQGIAPHAAPFFQRYPLIGPGFDDGGSQVRLAADQYRFWVKTLANFGVAGAAAWAAVALMRRYRTALVEWRGVGIGVGVLVVFIAASGAAREYAPQRLPDAILAPDPEGPQYSDLAVRGELAYITTSKGGLAVADLRDRRNLRQVGGAGLAFGELWHGTRAAVVDSMVYVVGRLKGLPSDSLGFVAYDVADPAAPVYKGRRLIEPADKDLWWWHWLATEGGFLLARQRRQQTVLQAFVLDGEQMPQPAAEVVIETLVDDGRDPGWNRRPFKMDVRGRYAYIGTQRECVVVDVGNPHALRETARFALDDFRGREGARQERSVAVDGDRLYVERHWPRELAAFDLSDPARPREVGYLVWDDRAGSLKVADGVAYGDRWDEIRIWDIADYGVMAARQELVVPDKYKRGYSNYRITVADGRLYQIKGGALVAFDVDVGSGD